MNNDLIIFLLVLWKLSPVFIIAIGAMVVLAVLERRDKSVPYRYPLSCDTCWREFHYEPRGSFQTYNAEWFCSDECGRKAGW